MKVQISRGIFFNFMHKVKKNYHHLEYGLLFDWNQSIANTCLDNILTGSSAEDSFNAHLQSDGLRAYGGVFTQLSELPDRNE